MSHNHEDPPAKREAAHDLPKGAEPADCHCTCDAEERAASDGEAQELEVGGEEGDVFERADGQHQTHRH
eukprot:scaffold42629_cov55-Phaeocystis_antarctica.AAC.3